MIGSMRVEAVSVPVSDQERAKQFYVGTLGFDLVVDNMWREGMRWSEVASEGSATSLMLVSWQAGMAPRHVQGRRHGYTRHPGDP
jgi:catechol 2,3-dioxygenase-like lactoylglutathione lyase family enzyme